jgi:hypothetical protein
MRAWADPGVLNECFADLGLDKHPEKTFIGRVERGFDFLGYHLSLQGIRLARQTWQRFAARAARLQEQERSGSSPPGALGAYVRRFEGWARGGLPPHVLATNTSPARATPYRNSRLGTAPGLTTAPDTHRDQAYRH